MKKELLKACQERIGSLIHRTPVLTSQAINQLAGARLFFKCENFQKTGSFKMRGAMNAVAQLSEEQKAKGVVTHSSGNFAQAVAYSAKQLGVTAYIVMPENAPTVKKEAVRGYGGIVTECEPTIQAREAHTLKIMQEKGATPLHPSNQKEVIIGQGSAAMELLEDYPDLEAIITPVGGGGLLAGTALAAHYYGQNCKVYAGEPMAADDAWRSLQSGQIETNETAHTIADGLRTHLGDINFPVIQQHVEQIIRVEEDEIVQAMRLIWERMKIVIEPSCAVPLAALLREPTLFAGKKVGIILSGGNVDLGSFFARARYTKPVRFSIPGPGEKKKITRPTLLLDEVQCKANIRRMADKARRHELVFRPHFKTPQSVQIGEWFREEGVNQITVSSLSMADYFASAGWEDITVAFPANVLEIDLINALARRSKLRLLVEAAEGVKLLNKGLQSKVEVMIKVNLGNNRTGIPAERFAEIDEVLKAIEGAQQLRFAGFLGHAGQSYRARGLAEIAAVHQHALGLMQRLKDQYLPRYPKLLLSYGDTPTCSRMDHFEGIDELRPGNFAFYDLMQQQIGSCEVEQIAVAMACPVVAIQKERSELVIYGGGIHFSKESIEDKKYGKIFGQLVENKGAGWGDLVEGAYLRGLSQEHGMLKVPPSLIDQYPIGSIVKILPIHSCMTANLMKSYQTLEGERIEMML